MKNSHKLQLKNVSKSFGDLKVLDDINLNLDSGESLVIVGPSGTGKSVLLKCILGLIQIDHGKILVGNNPLSQAPSGFFGMLFQGSALFDSLPIWHNIAFGLIHGKGMDVKSAKNLALEALERVGLSLSIQNHLPFEISGGMQKRVSLARALVMKPEVLFFDEPTAGLDPIMSSVINNVIAQTMSAGNATSITITHDMHCLSHVASRVAMLFKGKIIWQGIKEEFFQTDNPYVVQFRNGQTTGPFFS